MTQGQYIKSRIVYRLFRKRWDLSSLPLTFRWCNTAGSLLLTARNDDPGSLGGVRPGEAGSFCHTLETWWDIVDHDTALETMTELLYRGMRGRLDLKMEELWQERQKNGGGLPSHMDRLAAFWQAHGDKTFLGWDLCRACFVTTWCHVCGYLTLEEMMEICVTAAQMLQEAFSSWDEAMESYLAGLFLWSEPETPEERRSFLLRVYIYRILRWRRGPYRTVPFRASLSKTITDEERAKMHISTGA